MCIKAGLSSYYSAVVSKRFNMANYQICQGIRNNSTVYIHDQYRYTVAKSYKEYKRLRCVQYKNFLCSGAAFIKSETIAVIKPHNHERDECEVLQMKVREALKKGVRERKEQDVRSVYESIISTYPDNVKRMVPWKTVRSTMYSLRKQLPATVAEDVPIVEDHRQDDRCNVCLLPTEQVWLFDPCGHYPFCAGCSSTIVQEELDCPICRHAILKRMRIFHS